jgi:hypothetical protein
MYVELSVQSIPAGRFSHVPQGEKEFVRKGKIGLRYEKVLTGIT